MFGAPPQGWSHQISAGGEPTLRYGTARQALLSEYGQGPLHGDSKWTVAGSIGTVTEASLALNARWGRIESPWWAFTPEQTMYVQETQPIAPPLGFDAAPEVFLFAGARAKLRVYNAYLQGQFRHADLSYGEGDVNSDRRGMGGCRVAHFLGLGAAISRALGIVRVARWLGLALFYVGQHRGLEVLPMRCPIS